MYEFTVKNTNIKVKINQTYHVDDEQYFDYSIYLGDKLIIESTDSVEYNSIDFTEPEQEMTVYKKYIEENLDNILNKPRLIYIPNKLLKYIFMGLAQSDSNMCFVNPEEWVDLVENEEYTQEDLEQFKYIVDFYKLNNVIETNSADYVIIAYTDLLTYFNYIDFFD